MKSLKLLSILCLVSLAACNSQVATETGPRGTVLRKLEKAVENGGYMYAMQDALCYGKSWHPEEGELQNWNFENCDIKEVTGDYPAIAGFDLGGIELGDKANLDGVDFDFMRRAAVCHASRGGIVTFSWHLRNPLTGGDAWDPEHPNHWFSTFKGAGSEEDFIKFHNSDKTFFLNDIQ